MVVTASPRQTEFQILIRPHQHKMGCQGSKQPIYSAKCDTAIGQKLEIPYFCSVSGVGGNGARSEACRKIGKEGEYGDAGSGGHATCFYEDKTNNACTAGGGVIGSKGVCTRLAFKGDPNWCCTVGLGPTGTTSPCFVDGNDKNGTCPPDARSATGNGCMKVYLPSDNSRGYCNPESFDKFKELWNPDVAAEKNYCYKALQVNEEDKNYSNVRALGGVLMEGYFSRYSLVEPGQTGYNEFQEKVYDICKKHPYACANYLQTALCTSYTRDSVIEQPAVHSFCGCHLQSNQYETFLNEQAGVSRECDTVCIPDRVVKSTDGSGQRQICQSTVCAIDGVTIKLINSRAGDISLSQACGSNCQAGGCVCIFKDIDISGENARIGNIDFGQDCAQKTCYVTSAEDGGLVRVDCDKYKEEAEDAANNPSERNNVEGDERIATSFIVIGVIIFILLLILIIAAIR